MLSCVVLQAAVAHARGGLFFSFSSLDTNTRNTNTACQLATSCHAQGTGTGRTWTWIPSNKPSCDSNPGYPTTSLGLRFGLRRPCSCLLLSIRRRLVLNYSCLRRNKQKHGDTFLFDRNHDTPCYLKTIHTTGSSHRYDAYCRGACSPTPLHSLGKQQ